jgi:hypothetical protein
LGKELARLFYPKSLKTKIDFKIRKGSVQYLLVLDLEIDLVPGSSKSNLKTGTVCEYEGCEATEKLEAHHINLIATCIKEKIYQRSKNLLFVEKEKWLCFVKKHHQALHKKRIFKDK